MTPCAPAPALQSHHELGGSTSPVADAEHQGRTQTCLHILLQLFGYICERCPQNAPFLSDLWPPLWFWPQTCTCSHWRSSMFDHGQCYGRGAAWGAGSSAAFRRSGRTRRCAYLLHGATLEANGAPDSPGSQQVHAALVHHQVPYTAHVMREGR